jgi:hypothetical protein
VGIEVTVVKFVMIIMTLNDVYAVIGKHGEVEKKGIFFKIAISSFVFDIQWKLAFLRGQFVSLYFRQALMA